MADADLSLRDTVPEEKLPEWVVISGLGREITSQRIIPLLKHSRTYKRSTGYFSARVLLKNAEGIHRLIKNNGEMRLILGAHDIPPELIEASRFLSQEEAERIIEKIGENIVQRLDFFVDRLSRESIKCLAWMLKKEKLKVKVALPVDTYLRRADGIFHQKSMIFEDGNNIVTATGSGNETVLGSTDNGEKWDFHFSWIAGHEWHVSANLADFDKIWEGKHEDFYTFTLPEAVERKIWTYYEDIEVQPEIAIEPASERINPLGDVARVLIAMRNHQFFWHFALGPVRLYPHQVYVVDEVMGKHPIRRILADEVGLGKTLEAGAVVKRLVHLGLAKRVLILCPGGLVGQWKDEMHRRFGMDFWYFDPSKRLLTLSSDEEMQIECSNPFDEDQVDLVLCSWHYARKARNRKSLVESENPFDIVVIDEAHSARKRSSEHPTLLFRLANDLSLVTPNILLMTATPIQIDPKEIHDLLSILGLGGRYWGEGEEFEKFYRKLSTPDLVRLDDLEKLLRMVREGGRRYLHEDLVNHLLSSVPDKQASELLAQILLRDGEIGELSTYAMKQGKKTEIASSLLPLFAPVHWYMVRNTRKSLQALWPSLYRFPRRILADDVVGTDDSKIEDLRREISEYITETIPYSLEEIGTESIVGFMKSIYRQRFCSSLHALRITLSRRRETLRAIIAQSRAFEEKYEDWHSVRELEDVEEDTEDLFGDLDLGVVAQMMLDRILDDLREYGISELRDRLEEEIQKLDDLILGLEPYSRDPMSDPKIGMTTDKIKKAFSDGKKLLVFSRYTDTVHILKEALRVDGTIPSNKVAIFTGGGACMFGSDFEDAIQITKDEISNGLEEGLFSVVLCSDAASEGFNLHAASVVLNVDIPWNPSKIEQRIGRADRLGHDPDVPIEVHYIWYSEQDSVERKMYEMVMKRQDLKRMIIGPAQEIVSRSIADAVSKGEKIESRVVEKVAESIERSMKENSQLFQVMEGMKMEEDERHESLDSRLESCLEKFFFLACSDLGIELRREGDRLIFEDEHTPPEIRGYNWGRFSIGKSDYLSLTHPMMDYLLKTVSERYALGDELKPRFVSQTDEFNNCRILLVGDTDETEMNPQEIIDYLENDLEAI